jgi:hypothetical protein
MSIIKSQDENLTLNAHGSGNDIKFQSNGVEKASISSAGAFTSTTIDATALTGNLPAISGAALTGVGVAGITSSADATAITIDSNEQVTMGGTTLYPGQGNTATGQHFENTGTGYLSRTGGYALGVNRNTSDGTLINFARQGSSVGSIDASTSGISIKLGGTAAANALDDYEEGTWTPSINDGSPTYTTTYARTGVYTKIGNVVHIYMELYMGAISFGDATLTLVFSGLPFASRSTGDTFGMGMASSVTWSSIYTNGSTYNTGSMADSSILHASPTILSNSSVFRISLSGKSNIGRSYLKNAAFHNGSGMAIGLTYHTA